MVQPLPSAAGDTRARELATHIALARSATPISLLLMIGFVGFDIGYGWWVARVPLGPLLAIRAALVGVFGLQALWYRQEAPDRRVTPWVWRTSHCLFGVGLAVASALSDGVVSLYPAGLPLGLAAACTWYPMRFWRGYAELLATAAVSWVALALGLALGPHSDQLRSAGGLFALASWAMIFSSGALYGAGIGHRIWLLNRDVWESRDFGKYQIRRKLGQGGMGEVWAAWNTTLRREVAVKLLRDTASPEAMERFQREVQSTTRLSHPNTVRVFDYGITPNGTPYYAMELLEGETLAERVARRGPLDPISAVRVLDQAARALAEAHELGIVHRDVKPENLFLARAGGELDFVKLLDFGVARVLSNDTVTHTGSYWGTPSYLAPEILVGQAVLPASDVYALGGTLYFALAGSPPFRAAHTAAIITMHLRNPVQRPSNRLGKPLPEDLEALILRSLAKDAAGRPADARAFADQLARCRVGPDAPMNEPDNQEDGRAMDTLVSHLLDIPEEAPAENKTTSEREP